MSLHAFLRRSVCVLLLGAGCIPLRAQPAVQWVRTVADWPIATSVTQAADGSIYVVGNTSSGLGLFPYVTDSENTICLLKLSPEGDLLWTRTYEDLEHLIVAAAVLPASDTGIVLAGTRRVSPDLTTAYLRRVDDQGHTLWERSVGTAADLWIGGAARTTEGDYVLAGRVMNDASDPYLAKTDAEGRLRWEQTYALPHAEVLNGVTILPNNEGMAVGERRYLEADTMDHRRDVGLFALRIRPDGTLLWADTLSTSGVALSQIGTGISHLNDQLYMTGIISFSDPDHSAFIAATDGEGTVRWGQSVGATWENPDIMYPTTESWAVAATPDGHLLVGGIQTGVDFAAEAKLEDGLVAAFDTTGSHLWSLTLGERTTYEKIYALAPLSNGDIIAAGVQTGGMYVAKLTHDAAASRPPVSVPHALHLSTPHPHPVRTTAMVSFHVPTAGVVSLVLFDVLGRQIQTVFHEVQGAGTHQVSFQASALPSGIYLLRLTTADASIQRPVVIMR